MESVYVCVRAIFPMFMFMALGFVLKRTEMLCETSVTDINKLVFKVILPVMSFELSRTADVSLIPDNLMLICFGGLYLAGYTAIAIAIVKKISWTDDQKTSFVMAISFGNTVSFGLPLAISYYGAGGISVITAMFTILLPLSTVVAVVILSSFGKSESGFVRSALKTLKSPIIIGLLLGYVFNYLKIPVPELVTNLFSSLTATSTPLLYICIGAAMKFGFERKDLKLIVPALLLKIVIIPGVAIAAAAAMGFRGASIFAVIAGFANPTAVSSASFIRGSGRNGELATTLVMYSSLVSMFSVLICMITCRQLGLI